MPKSIWHVGVHDLPVKSSVPTLEGRPKMDKDTLCGEPLVSVRWTVPAGVSALPASIEIELGETEIEKSNLVGGEVPFTVSVNVVEWVLPPPVPVMINE